MTTFIENVKPMQTCRICRSSRLEIFFDMGKLPLPNAFLARDDLEQADQKFPLAVCFCHDCALVQLHDIINPDVMFKNYLYVSSGSTSRLNDFHDIAAEAYRRFHLCSDSLVVDIGSNDGSLLSCFKELGVQVLGIDPAENLKAIAEQRGVSTLLEYFNPELAHHIVYSHRPASVVTATNVFAHIENVHELMAAIHTVLETDGVFISQFPYVLDLLQGRQFDTIYHEHMSYYSLKPLLRLAELTGFTIFDIEHNNLDGGAIRVFWKKKENTRWPIQEKQIAHFIAQEEKAGLYHISAYQDFNNNINAFKQELLDTLRSIKHAGKRIVGYGAPAKGTILLNYFGIGRDLLDYVVDSTTRKQGLFVPGVHLEIFPEAKIREDQPDYLLVLAWNFAKEIIEKNHWYTEKGGKFIVPDKVVSIV